MICESYREAAEICFSKCELFSKKGGGVNPKVHTLIFYFFFKGSVKTMKMFFKKGLFHSPIAYLKF